MNLLKINLGFWRAYQKILPKFENFLPMFRKKRQKWKLFKRNDSKSVFPGLVKISFHNPADLLFKSLKTFVPSSKQMLQWKTFLLQNKYLEKLLRPQSAGLKTVKKISLDVRISTAQTQKTNTGLLHFQKQVHQTNLWTCRMQIGHPAEVFS